MSDNSQIAGRRVCRPKVAFDRIGCGKTKGYELIADGRLDARSLDGMTLITEESIEALLASLPPAAVRQKAAA